MDPLRNLIDAIQREDGALRRLLGAFPREYRELESTPEELSVKDTLGHLAYWDDFTVHFFLCKLDPGSHRVPPPQDFEQASRLAMAEMRKLPYGEVLARYLEATGALLDFLERHWNDLSEKERADFQVPLKHRRQHRSKLAAKLRKINLSEEGQDPREMSEPA